MKSVKAGILSVSFLWAIIIPQSIIGNPILLIGEFDKKMTCQEALKNVQLLKVGMKDSEIIDLIGTPAAKSDNTWNYSFWECVTPKVGSQDIIGVSLVFNEHIVKEINWATICATGSGDLNPPKKKTRQSKK
jgi:hypothetical protein